MRYRSFDRAHAVSRNPTCETVAAAFHVAVLAHETIHGSETSDCKSLLIVARLSYSIVAPSQKGRGGVVVFRTPVHIGRVSVPSLLTYQTRVNDAVRDFGTFQAFLSAIASVRDPQTRRGSLAEMLLGLLFRG